MDGVQRMMYVYPSARDDRILFPESLAYASRSPKADPVTTLIRPTISVTSRYGSKAGMDVSMTSGLNGLVSMGIPPYSIIPFHSYF